MKLLRIFFWVTAIMMTLGLFQMEWDIFSFWALAHVWSVVYYVEKYKKE